MLTPTERAIVEVLKNLHHRAMPIYGGFIVVRHPKLAFETAYVSEIIHPNGRIDVLIAAHDKSFYTEIVYCLLDRNEWRGRTEDEAWRKYLILYGHTEQ